jgi:diguanylate cyclase (GGDEF)-like protein
LTEPAIAADVTGHRFRVYVAEPPEAVSRMERPTLERRLAEHTQLVNKLIGELSELHQEVARLKTLVMTDDLTGLKNRRHFREALEFSVTFAREQGLPLSVLMLDLDAFKPYNDAFGHPAGDEVLCTIAGIIRATTRAGDIPARYGGEEFLVLLPGADANGARLLAERLRCAIESHPWPCRSVTASLGIATKKSIRGTVLRWSERRTKPSITRKPLAETGQLTTRIFPG